MNRKHSKTCSEFLILPGGRILAHNLTPTMARVLAGLNPHDLAMSRRADSGTGVSPVRFKTGQAFSETHGRDARATIK